MAEVMQRQCARGEYKLDPESLVVGAGCNSVLENLFFCIADPGEGVLVPQPFYAAFKFDLGSRAGLQVLPVPVMPKSILKAAREDEFLAIPASAYYPTAESLERAYQAAKLNGVQPRAVLLTTPNNPLGICYPEEVLAECVDWAESHGLHTVSDEIYAGSTYGEGNGGWQASSREALAGLESEQHSTPWCSVSTLAARRGRRLGDKQHLVSIIVIPLVTTRE
jgi:aspartate/methionine/tyrosine aminotransferase